MVKKIGMRKVYVSDDVRNSIHDIIDLILDSLSKIITYIINIDVLLRLVFARKRGKITCAVFIDDSDKTYWLIMDSLDSSVFPINAVIICLQLVDKKEYRWLFNGKTLVERNVLDIEKKEVIELPI